MQNREALWVQVEVVAGVVVFPDAATVTPTQEVAAELGGYGDVGDVRVQSGGQVGCQSFARTLERKRSRVVKKKKRERRSFHLFCTLMVLRMSVKRIPAYIVRRLQIHSGQVGTRTLT